METLLQDLKQGVAEMVFKYVSLPWENPLQKDFWGWQQRQPGILDVQSCTPPPKIDLNIAGKNIFDNDIWLQQDSATPLAVLVTPAVLATLAAAPPSSIYLFTICPSTNDVIAIHKNLWIALPNDVTNTKERLLDLLNNRPAIKGCKNVWIGPSPHPWLRAQPAILLKADNYRVVWDCVRGNQQQALGHLTSYGLGEVSLSPWGTTASLTADDVVWKQSLLSPAVSRLPICNHSDIDKVSSK